MTKLTNEVRDAFVRAVMADVPLIDYQEQAQARIDAAVQASFPGTNFKELFEAGWLRDNSTYSRSMGMFRHLGPALTTLPDVSDIATLQAAQNRKRENVRSTVRALAYSHTTLKRLREAAPELAKYLPADAPKVDRTVPVVQSDVVGALKAAGWPK